MRATAAAAPVLLLAFGCGSTPPRAPARSRPAVVDDGGGGRPPVDLAPNATQAEEMTRLCDGASGLVARPRGPIAARWDHHFSVGGEGTLDVAWCGAGSVSVRQVIVGDSGRWIREYDRGTQVASRGRPLALAVPGRPAPGSSPVTVVAIDGDGHEQRATTSIESVDDPARAAAVAACKACGGDWGPAGMLGYESCDCPTHDAGKPCHSHQECESACMATGFEPIPAAELPPAFTCPAGQRAERLVGRCHDRQQVFGCRPLLDDPGPHCMTPGGVRTLPSTCTD
ncbi:MAG TPA: hypothetical protein VHE35_23535 [Kofleriaceae bacterium]|nr:hypothetical protein [Kofleriaceae bacterium]